MTSIRTQQNLVSFALSAMMTSGLLATAPQPYDSAATGPQPAALIKAVDMIRGSGWTGSQAVPSPEHVTTPAMIPAKVDAPAAPILTPEQIAHLQRLITGPNGKTIGLIPRFAAALGLAPNGETVIIQSVSIKSVDGKIVYQFSAFRDRAGYLVANTDGTTIWLFQLDANLTVVRAASGPLQGALAPLGQPDADRLANANLSVWASNLPNLPSA